MAAARIILKCVRCDTEFKYPSELAKHNARKTPCDPVVENAEGEHKCHHCGRGFQSRKSMQRHVRDYCKMTNAAVNPVKTTFQQMLQHQTEQLARLTAKIEQLVANKAAEKAPNAAADDGRLQSDTPLQSDAAQTSGDLASQSESAESSKPTQRSALVIFQDGRAEVTTPERAAHLLAVNYIYRLP